MEEKQNPRPFKKRKHLRYAIYSGDDNVAEEGYVRYCPEIIISGPFDPGSARLIHKVLTDSVAKSVDELAKLLSPRKVCEFDLLDQEVSE